MTTHPNGHSQKRTKETGQLNIIGILDGILEQENSRREIWTFINIINTGCDKCTILMWDANNRRNYCCVYENFV